VRATLLSENVPSTLYVALLFSLGRRKVIRAVAGNPLVDVAVTYVNLTGPSEF
jgi:hypothetical protein